MVLFNIWEFFSFYWSICLNGMLNYKVGGGSGLHGGGATQPALDLLGDCEIETYCSLKDVVVRTLVPV